MAATGYPPSRRHEVFVLDVDGHRGGPASPASPARVSTPRAKPPAVRARDVGGLAGDEHGARPPAAVIEPRRGRPWPRRAPKDRRRRWVAGLAGGMGDAVGGVTKAPVIGAVAMHGGAAHGDGRRRASAMFQHRGRAGAG